MRKLITKFKKKTSKHQKTSVRIYVRQYIFSWVADIIFKTLLSTFKNFKNLMKNLDMKSSFSFVKHVVKSKCVLWFKKKYPVRSRMVVFERVKESDNDGFRFSCFKTKLIEIAALLSTDFLVQELLIDSIATSPNGAIVRTTVLGFTYVTTNAALPYSTLRMFFFVFFCLHFFTGQLDIFLSPSTFMYCHSFKKKLGKITSVFGGI
jgi:hypothetical protein